MLNVTLPWTIKDQMTYTFLTVKSDIDYSLGGNMKLLKYGFQRLQQDVGKFTISLAFIRDSSEMFLRKARRFRMGFSKP